MPAGDTRAGACRPRGMNAHCWLTNFPGGPRPRHPAYGRVVRGSARRDVAVELFIKGQWAEERLEESFTDDPPQSVSPLHRPQQGCPPIG